jgi:translation initiation factor 2 subunit 3
MADTTGIDMKEIMQNQAVVNIGMVGHVANGKTTVTSYLTGIKTTKYSSEKTQNKTIRLGYANVKIWKCNRCNAYESTGSDIYKVECECNQSQSKDLITHISIVDCPGHNMLISTMLNGSSVMDYTMLVESAENKDCPAPQTAEHFRATQIAGIPNAMILMNKIDIQKRQKIVERVAKLEQYVRQETNYDISQKIAPIVPVSATFGTNLDVVCEYLGRLNIPDSRDSRGVFEMLVIRSFDVNKPGLSESTPSGKKPSKSKSTGTDVRNIKGGVIGGSIMRGRLDVSDRLIILPGRHRKLTKEEKDDNKTEADFCYTPIVCVAKSIQSEKNDMKMAIAGGLMAIQVTIDPAHTRNDGLTGSVVLKESDYLASFADSQSAHTYRVFDKIIVRMENFMIDKSKLKSLLSNNTVIKINVNSNTIKAMVLKYSKKSNELRLYLVRPIPITDLNDHVTVMVDASTVRTNQDIGIDTDTSVIGSGKILDGIEAIKME